jgi:hypothetical protein
LAHGETAGLHRGTSAAAVPIVFTSGSYKHAKALGGADERMVTKIEVPYLKPGRLADLLAAIQSMAILVNVEVAPEAAAFSFTLW